MEAKLLGWLQVIGGAAAMYFGWGSWSIVILSALFILVGIHHLKE